MICVTCFRCPSPYATNEISALRLEYRIPRSTEGSGRKGRFTVLMCPRAVRGVLGVEKSLELYKRTQS
jgi:hypothetical protein